MLPIIQQPSNRQTHSGATWHVLVVASIVIVAALARLIPHSPNVTPITAMALFGGAYFSSRRLAIAVPLIAMLISDLLLGFHPAMPFVYASLILVSTLGMWIQKRKSARFIVGASLLASVAFFVVSNFGFWLTMGIYPISLVGLASCYAAAIPFFRDALAADLFFTCCLFGGFELATRIAALRLKPNAVRVRR